MTKAITEEMGIHKEWMKRAKEMTLEDLPAFLKELTEDYDHDYGTICHAIAAAAVAAAWAVERTPQGGITGFQASAISWEMLKGWDGLSLGETGSRLLNMDDMLYPQHEDRFRQIRADTWDAVQKKAKAMIEEKSEHVHPNVLAHWESVAAGNVPFGLTVENTH